MKSAASYSRVSTTEQAESGYSLKTQVAAARKYAAANELALPEELEITDDCSGASLDRPGLIRLRQLVTSGKICVVIVYSADRLSRNLGHLIILREEFKHYGVELHYVRKGKLEDTAEARLLDNVEGTIGEYEREKIVERTLRGKVAKAKSGKIVGAGGPLYGYRIEGRKHETQVTIVEHEASVIREVFHLYLYGDDGNGPLSTREIARRLTDRREPTQADIHGKARKTNRRGYWSGNNITRILHQPAYIGEAVYHSRKTNEDIIVPMPPIVSRKDFNEAQKRLKHNKYFALRNAVPGRYLLSGLIFCGHCNKRMVGSNWGKDGNERYVCLNRKDAKMNDNAPCPQASIRADVAEAAAWEYLQEMVNSDALEDSIKEFVSRADEQRASKAKAIDEIAAEIAKCEAEAARLADLAASGGVVGTALAAKADALNVRHDSLVKEQAKLQQEFDATPTADQATAAIELRDKIRQNIAGPLSRERMQALLAAIGMRITVIRNRGTYRFDNPDLMMYPHKVILLRK